VGGSSEIAWRECLARGEAASVTAFVVTGFLLAVREGLVEVRYSEWGRIHKLEKEGKKKALGRSPARREPRIRVHECYPGHGHGGLHA
jgi:hypothetical protein